MTRLRLPIAFLSAWCLSVALFWLLRVLIGASVSLDQIQAPPKIEFVRMRKDTDVEEKKRAKPQIEKPEPPPKAENVIASKELSVIPGADLAVLAPRLNYSGAGGGVGGLGAAQLAIAGGTDRSATPQVRIQPDYPIVARQKGIEGWVDVRFDIGADGSVRNPVAVDADPKGIFERSAIQAMKGWKYSPKIEDGRAVESKGHKIRLTFKLET